MEYDFNKISRDLRNMRERMEVMESRKKKFKFPSNVTKVIYAFFKDGNLIRYSRIKKSLNDNYCSLKKKYPDLRYLYSKRFGHLSTDDLLRYNEIKNGRIEDLMYRREYLLSMKKNRIHVKLNKSIDNLVSKLDEELNRRSRNSEDLIKEFEDRGLSLETIYTQKMIEKLSQDVQN